MYSKQGERGNGVCPVLPQMASKSSMVCLITSRGKSALSQLRYLREGEQLAAHLCERKERQREETWQRGSGPCPLARNVLGSSLTRSHLPPICWLPLFPLVVQPLSHQLQLLLPYLRHPREQAWVSHSY